jgi:hypothetical protein
LLSSGAHSSAKARPGVPPEVISMMPTAPQGWEPRNFVEGTADLDDRNVDFHTALCPRVGARCRRVRKMAMEAICLPGRFRTAFEPLAVHGSGRPYVVGGAGARVQLSAGGSGERAAATRPSQRRASATRSRPSAPRPRLGRARNVYGPRPTATPSAEPTSPAPPVVAPSAHRS